MVLLRNRNQDLTETEFRRILFLCDGFRETDLGIDLISNAFRGSIQNIRLFSIFSSLIFCSIIYLFEKRKGACSCLPVKGYFRLFIIFIQRMISLMVILFSAKCFLFVYMYIDLLKLKACKLFENSDADLSWLPFLKKPTCPDNGGPVVMLFP